MVETGDQLMIVVPAKGGIEVEAMVENRDRCFVEADQPAEIKVETFPYTKYGTIPGKVVQVSTDSIERKDDGLVFPARITLSHDFIHTDGEDVKRRLAWRSPPRSRPDTARSSNTCLPRCCATEMKR